MRRQIEHASLSRLNMKTKDQMRLGLGTALRRTDEELSFGTFTEVKEGQPIPEGAELAHLSGENEDGWRDVTSVYKRESAGPAQVATPAYREGYDRIFWKKQKVGVA
jgi:hypothetical protein